MSFESRIYKSLCYTRLAETLEESLVKRGESDGMSVDDACVMLGMDVNDLDVEKVDAKKNEILSEDSVIEMDFDELIKKKRALDVLFNYVRGDDAKEVVFVKKISSEGIPYWQVVRGVDYNEVKRWLKIYGWTRDLSKVFSKNKVELIKDRLEGEGFTVHVRG